MSEPVCKCGHPRSRHFAGSMVKGHHACLAVIDSKRGCECRRFDQAPEQKKLTPAQEAQRNRDLL